MGLEKFCIATLAEMDGGRIGAAFEQALKRCEDDCKDRPGVKEPRRLSLTVTLEPIADEGELDSVNITFKITDSVPKRCSKTYNMKSVPGGLLFNDMSPEDVKQGTLELEAPGPKATKETADVG